MTTEHELPVWIVYTGTPAADDFAIIARGNTEAEAMRAALASGKATTAAKVGRIVPKREKSASLEIQRGFILSGMITCDYGGSGQGFGGYSLYLGRVATHHEMLSCAGHWIYRCLEVAGVEKWIEMPGKTIRVRRENGRGES